MSEWKTSTIETIVRRLVAMHQEYTITEEEIQARIAKVVASIPRRRYATLTTLCWTPSTFANTAGGR
jgi:hypothetical protein